jgi:V-type H+-transporting ATPase subunit C
MSTNYFLISVPSKKESAKKTIGDLEGRIRKVDRDTTLSEFDVPFQELKVGNIDALIYLSDALKKTCVTVESTIRKVCQLYLDLQTTDEEKNPDKKPDNKTGEKKSREIEVKGVKPEDALTKFKWEDARYPKRKPLSELCNAIKGSIAEIEKELREKSLEYNTICQKLAQMSANESGNLMTRDINTIIKEYNKDKIAPQQFKPVESLLPQDTIQMLNDFNASSSTKLQPFLTTLYVVVPKNDQKFWRTNYEGLLDESNEKKVEDEVQPQVPHFLVPRSSVLLAQDNDSCLNSVVVFTKDIEEFKAACRSRRYTVRRNDPSTVINEEEKQSLKKAQDKKKKLLVRWALNSFGDAFNGWLHLKCIQCFVESILRYGLPPECVAMLISPKKGGEKKTCQTTL